MRFQVLSHAGLKVTSGDKMLLTDPWVIGSCYWRSWWNYPPVTPELVATLKPDFIYLTHIHWDHFQGPSLRKFDKQTRIYVPKGNFCRIRDDLVKMGLTNVVELKHGESVELAPDFKITSYQFNPFLDSAVVIECEGITILNANDAKFMGGPLKQIIDRHPQIDFVLRSHSSANSRLCYDVIDAPPESVDDVSSYIREFANFAQSTGATYAVPFASNQCHLHKESYRFNDIVQTPEMVRDYFEEHHITSPIVKVMVSGDSWSTDEGFEIHKHDFYSNRIARLAEYRDANAEKLETFYGKESRSKVTLADMQKFYDPFFKTIPFFVRRGFRNKKITYVLTAGEKETAFRVDVYNRTVEEIESYNDDTDPIQIHTSALIMRQCLKMHLFSHLSISKRVRFRMRKADKKYVERLNLLYNLYEYDMLPMRRLFQPRALETWLLRWREIVLYFQLVIGLVLTGKLNTAKYMPPRPRPDAMQRTEEAIARAKKLAASHRPAPAPEAAASQTG